MKQLFLRLRPREWFDRWLQDYPRATPIGVFAVAFMLVLIASWSVELAEKRMRQTRLQSEVEDIVSALERQAAADTAYLEATSAVFASVNSVSPDFFHNFVDRLRGSYDLDGVVGLGWTEMIWPADVPALRDRMSAAGFPMFEIRPPPAQWPIHVVTMLEPQTSSNKAVVGFNLHSEARRGAAMDRAFKTESVAATDSIKLTQDTAQFHSPGFLVFAPVWSLATNRHFRGYVFIPIRTKDFVTSAVSRRLLEGGRIKLFDPSPSGAELIYSSTPVAVRFSAPIEEKVAVFDQLWTLRYEALERSAFFPLTFVVLLGGLAFSVLLLAYVLLVQRRHGDLHALLNVKLAQEKERVAFIRELNHRVKNSLANVTSIISLTRNRAQDLDSFADTLLQRVRALAASHSLLDGGEWAPTKLKTLIMAQLCPYDRTGDRIDIAGPDALVSPNDALTIGLAFHELATNATRFGALSSDLGTVAIRWHIADDNWVEVEWIEAGGPEVTPPPGRGFGLNLIERALAHELRRPIELSFPPGGFRCRFFVQMRAPREFQLRK
jgi:two-component sensor histidine kinase